MVDFRDKSNIERMLHAQYVADIEEKISAIAADEIGTTTIFFLDGTVVSLSRKAILNGVKPVFDFRMRVQNHLEEAYRIREQLYTNNTEVHEIYLH